MALNRVLKSRGMEEDLGKPYGEVYLVRCRENGKVYVGQTIRGAQIRWEEHKKYAGKKFALSRALKKYGPEAFSFEVIDTAANQTELDSKEVSWIAHYNCIAPKGYNLRAGGDGGKPSEETLAKLRGRKMSPEAVEKGRLARIGQKRSEESRAAMRAAKLGKKQTAEHVANAKAARKNRVRSPETRAKISAALKGKKRTPEAIEATRRGRWGSRGIPPTPEQPSTENQTAAAGPRIGP